MMVLRTAQEGAVRRKVPESQGRRRAHQKSHKEQLRRADKLPWTRVPLFKAQPEMREERFAGDKLYYEGAVNRPLEAT